MKILVGAAWLALIAAFASQNSRAASQPAASVPTAPSAVAIVAELNGTASVTEPGQVKKTIPLEVFQWLPRNATITIAPSSSAVLVFASGRRFGLGAGAHVTLQNNDVETLSRGIGRSGRGATGESATVQALTPLPALPGVHAIAAGNHPAARGAVVRLRAGALAGLYPMEGTATIADETMLRFALARSASRYRVVIDDERGGTVFSAETTEPAVRVPPAVLKPGERYYWTVSTVDAVAGQGKGTAAFWTLTTDQTRKREALRASLIATADPRTLALLAEIDRGLGLLAEAREGLRAARDKAPDDNAIRLAFERVEQQFKDKT